MNDEIKALLEQYPPDYTAKLRDKIKEAERNRVLRFIGRFTENGNKPEVIECFTSGCCYWFAKILYERFCRPSYICRIVYDETANHWACLIGDRIYDIRGDITDLDYTWQDWTNMLHDGDELLVDRLIRDCIKF